MIKVGNVKEIIIMEAVKKIQEDSMSFVSYCSWYSPLILLSSLHLRPLDRGNSLKIEW